MTEYIRMLNEQFKGTKDQNSQKIIKIVANNNQKRKAKNKAQRNKTQQ